MKTPMTTEHSLSTLLSETRRTERLRIALWLTSLAAGFVLTAPDVAEAFAAAADSLLELALSKKEEDAR